MRWVRESVGEVLLDIRDSRRVVVHADPVIRVHPGWLADHGLDVAVQPDDGLILDSQGHYRYAHRAELGDGFHVYERI